VPTPRSAVFLGLFLMAGFGIPLVGALLSRLPAAPVAACDTYRSHGPKARVTLVDGAVAVLGTADLATPERCLPIGSILEKDDPRG
jgi:hypothetical protein